MKFLTFSIPFPMKTFKSEDCYILISTSKPQRLWCRLALFKAIDSRFTLLLFTLWSRKKRFHSIWMHIHVFLMGNYFLIRNFYYFSIWFLKWKFTMFKKKIIFSMGNNLNGTPPPQTLISHVTLSEERRYTLYLASNDIKQRRGYNTLGIPLYFNLIEKIKNIFFN